MRRRLQAGSAPGGLGTGRLVLERVLEDVLEDVLEGNRWLRIPSLVLGLHVILYSRLVLEHVLEHGVW